MIKIFSSLRTIIIKLITIKNIIQKMGNTPTLVRDFKDGECGETHIKKSLVPLAKLSGVQEGSCASAGYGNFIENRSTTIPT